MNDMQPQAIDPSPTLPGGRIRILTATSPFDGHDAAINLIRRHLQEQGAEVIHIGHNRRAGDIVEAAIQEGVRAVAVTSYCGGHLEFFPYLKELFTARDAGHIRIFGGGGNAIPPEDVRVLEDGGVERIYNSEDARDPGPAGIARDILRRCEIPGRLPLTGDAGRANSLDSSALSRLLLAITEMPDNEELSELLARKRPVPVIAVTGPGGSGKSSLLDELLRRLLLSFSDLRIAVLSIDPARKKTGGALLGDRVRMNSVSSPRVFMRSLAATDEHDGTSPPVESLLNVYRSCPFDLIFLETTGIGQGDSAVSRLADIALYVMTPEFGAQMQLEKIAMLDYADLVALNKADRRGARDALQAVRSQLLQNRQPARGAVVDMPVHATIASHFCDPGTNSLFEALLHTIDTKTTCRILSRIRATISPDRGTVRETGPIIPARRDQYLQEIVDEIERRRREADREAARADDLYALEKSLDCLRTAGRSSETLRVLEAEIEEMRERLQPDTRKILATWPVKQAGFRSAESSYRVRGKQIRVKNHVRTQSGLRLPKIAIPRFRSYGEMIRWTTNENFPGEFPFTAGVHPFRRTEEDPIRTFAAECTPEETNRKFHRMSEGSSMLRLSTAFDMATRFGEDPHTSPDIRARIGTTGVSVSCLDDMKKLFSGLRLADSQTSVSMTADGPAPMLLAFFFHTAVDQECEIYLRQQGLLDQARRTIDTLYSEAQAIQPVYGGELPPGHNSLGLALLGVTGDRLLPAEVYEKIRSETLTAVRGSIQADVLKEDQARNTCIFSVEFALRMMGDIQEFLIRNDARNFRALSVSGYQMAEAGANPISQLAFTLANGFTYLEYFLSRDMPLDRIASNISFFFSNGMDPEYAVLGRVARRLWARAIRYRYGGEERSQMLKYSIQTSDRSLHPGEITLNDIRTTLQALYAIHDNCNSLQTGHDERRSPETEESARKAAAIRLVINRELGLAKNENPLQGSFIIEELTDLVEEAVLGELSRISERGGVPGAMETMYQRTRILEDSLEYERMKVGGFQGTGADTFLNPPDSRATPALFALLPVEADRLAQITTADATRNRFQEETRTALQKLQKAAVSGTSLFDVLMETAKTATLGQMTHALFDIGGEYRRSM